MHPLIQKLPLVGKAVKIKDLFLTQLNTIQSLVSTIQSRLEAVEGSEQQIQSELRTLRQAVTELNYAYSSKLGTIEVTTAQTQQEIEQLLPHQPRDVFGSYIEPSTPDNMYVHFAHVCAALRRLKLKGWRPDFVLDIGASNGAWSHFVSIVFPAARYILVEPLASKYTVESLDHVNFMQLHPEFEMVEKAVSNKPGTLQLQVADNLVSSSLFTLPSTVLSQILEVPVITLDLLAQEKSIEGRGLIKMDIQFAEHLALEGAQELLKQVDGVILEIALYRYYKETKIFFEMLALMEQYGFRYYEDVGEYRLPADSTLSCKDGLFLRHGLFE